MSIPPLPFPSPDDSFSNTIPPNVEYIPNDPIAANNPNSNPPDVPLPIPTSSDDVHDNTSNSFPNDPNVNVGYSDGNIYLYLYLYFNQLMMILIIIILINPHRFFSGYPLYIYT